MIVAVIPVSDTLKKGNIQTLEDLLRHSPTVNRGLSLARTSEETTTSFQQDSAAKREAKKELYEVRFEGSFEIP